MVFNQVHLADRNPARSTKADKDFAKRHDFKAIKFSVKTSNFHKIVKKSIGISVFGSKNKEK